MHDNIKFICDSCHRRFATSQNLKAHKESVHENIKYNCNLCGKSMQYKSLIHHKKSIHKSRTTFNDSKFVKDDLAHDKRDQIVRVEIYTEEKNGQDETAQCNNSQDHSVQNEFDMGLLLYEEKNQEATNQGTGKSPDELGQNRSDHNESYKELLLPDETNQTEKINQDENDQSGHETDYDESEIFSCDMCKNVFTEIALLESHISLDHLKKSSSILSPALNIQTDEDKNHFGKAAGLDKNYNSDQEKSDEDLDKTNKTKEINLN